MESLKICPECGAEYTRNAQACADCRVPLQWRREPVALPMAPDEDPWVNVPEGIVGMVIEDDQSFVEEYAEMLAERGIASVRLPVIRLDEGGTPTPVRDGTFTGFRYCLFALREDYDEAMRLVEARFAQCNPALAETPYVEFPEEGCPACGASLPDNAEECPDCGLAFMD